jgi:hypothetical protein
MLGKIKYKERGLIREWHGLLVERKTAEKRADESETDGEQIHQTFARAPDVNCVIIVQTF